MSTKIIDLRSDTVTLPTDEMRIAMQEALVGDDVFGEDPTMNRLEKMSAEILGKEAALFVPSGTMGNQLSIMAQTHSGEEIILGAHSHIVHYESAAPAQLSGVSYAMVDNEDTHIYPEDVERSMRPRNSHLYPNSTLLCIENALSNGDVVELDEMKAVYQTAKKLGLKVHLDGARIFNAATYLKCDPKEIAANADSVMFCVSKGLASPVGSLMCGTQEFIDRARRCRKMVGGGMRQAGVLAACGIVSLEKMVPRLGEDHENAQYLGQKLSQIPGITVRTEHIKINLVYWIPTLPNFNNQDFCVFMDQKGIKVSDVDTGDHRFATHHNITKEDIDFAVAALKEYCQSIA